MLSATKTQSHPGVIRLPSMDVVPCVGWSISHHKKKKKIVRKSTRCKIISEATNSAEKYLSTRGLGVGLCTLCWCLRMTVHACACLLLCTCDTSVLPRTTRRFSFKFHQSESTKIINFLLLLYF